jgi:hypothetical protein
MGGGLMQLVAYGAQDIYLTGNPQITFFKVVYRRHTNFSMESIQQTWNGTSNGADGRCTATISRNGDLVHKMYIEITIATNGGNGNAFINSGSDWIKTCEIEIGGQQIDKITGQWMESWAELTEPNPGLIRTNGGNASASLGQDSGNRVGTRFQNMTGFGGCGQFTNGSVPLYIPLPFWFCRNPGLSLPLIALQYHEVKVILEHQLTTSISASATDQNLWVDYIYLDTDERRRFAQVSHEYLIEQLQYQQIADKNQVLNFNHPVKELVWVSASSVVSTKGQSEFIHTGLDYKTAKWKLTLNGHDRFAERPISYFTRQQVYDYHTGPGGLKVNASGSYQGVNEDVYSDAIYVYSFALKPEEHQPSGTCNFSRIDNAQLQCDTDLTSSGKWTIYAVNYNVLRIMSGMGGLAYSN